MLPTYTAYTYPSSNQYVKCGAAGFGAVPRGGVDYNESGGYYIDENSGYPTKGWTVENSAGLCALCHGSDIDELDQQTGESLWLSTNGHSNSAIGGTAIYKANIFDYTHGRPVPVRPPLGQENQNPGQRVANLGNQDMCMVSGDADFPYGYRNGDGGYFTPSVYGGGHLGVNRLLRLQLGHLRRQCHYRCLVSSVQLLQVSQPARLAPAEADDHQLPRRASQHMGRRQAKSDLEHQCRGRRCRLQQEGSYFASAQNCHRYDGSRATELEKGGWNKVTPW